ncbi:hypothetical protein [Arhodomonas sp. AD133]|uniref:hypothetical protein n=1 Tax=Arhodomonas sp. AD133 TaxID=3415009 RepID=UPI003EB74867
MRRATARVAAILAVAIIACSNQALAAIDTITLKHRPAETILPALRELAPQGVGLAADGFRLIVRGEPGEIASMREAVATLDRPLANLLVSVRHSGRATREQRRIEGRGQVGNDGASGHLEIRRTHSERDETGNQRVRTLEGHAARIDTGMTVPAGSRWLWAGRRGAGYAEAPAYRHMPDGFYAVPYLNGERVRVEIAVRRERPDGERTRKREVVTTVSGRLGEWIPLGGVSSGDRAGHWRTAKSAARIELRVERVR